MCVFLRKPGQKTGAFFLALAFLIFSLGASVRGQEKTEPPAVPVQGFTHEYTPQEQAFIQNTPEIMVSNALDWPPFDFVSSGTPSGFGIALMTLLAEKSGLSVSYVNGYTWEKLLQMFKNGEIDVIHSLSITPERQQYALFSTPYYHSRNVLVHRSDTEIRTLQDLDGKIIALPKTILALPKGWASIDFFKARYPEIHILPMDTSRQVFEYLADGKVAATVEQEEIARHLISRFGLTDLVLSNWIDDEELQKTASIHFAVHQSNPVLFSVLQKTLSNISHREMADLKAKWFSSPTSPSGATDAGLTRAEKDWLNEKKKITYCVQADRMPYSGLNGGQEAGMAKDLMAIFSRQLGIEFVPETVTGFGDQAMARVSDNTCDIVPLISKTPSRMRHLKFTPSYINFSVAIISRENTPFISDIPALKSAKVGLVKNSNIAEKILIRFPGLNYIQVDTVPLCLEMVSSGQLDAAVLSLPVAGHYIRNQGLTNLIVAGHASIKEDLRIGVKQEDSPLATIINKAVKSLPRKDVQAIADKWMSIEMRKIVDYALIWKIVGGAVLALGLVMFWNHKLARLNRQIARANEQLREKTRELEQISITDSLTGLYNRRYAESAFELELRRSIRHKRDLALMIIDIDHFKSVNDTYGHPAGDAVLVRFAGLLKKNIRSTDILGRWGGEEFIVICPEINVANAAHLAQSLCRKVAQARFETVGPRSASFGVTGLKAGDDMESMIHRADTALYQAKENGRNRVESLI